jgi:hypothetical protein
VDVDNNRVSSYSGPSSVTVTAAPVSAGSSFPTTVAIDTTGFGTALGTLVVVGTYTISTSVDAPPSPPSVTIVPANASKLAFGVQPVNAATGNKLANVVVDVVDPFGNTVTGDNSDSVTISVSGGPGGFLAGSTTTVPVVNGVATFSNLTLVSPGAYTLAAIVPAHYISPNSTSFTIAPLQVATGSFQSSPTGFSVSFNAPFLVTSTTPVLYGQGFGATAPVPTVTLTGPGGLVEGSVALNTATNSLTFIETDTANVYGNGLPPQLPDGTYTVRITSSAANNGLQAINAGGGFLDGTNSGTPGHDFTTTFTVATGGASAEALWIPATANGPKQTLQAPGNNISGGGYPVYINDSTGTVTSVTVTFNYNPTMLTIGSVSSNSNIPGTSFTLNTGLSTPGHAVLNFTGTPATAASLTGGNVPLGFINATVPNSSTTTPIYKGKDILSLTSISVNGGGITPVIGVGALHEVAFVGDANGDGAYSSGDAVLITRVGLQTDTGFTAYPLVDPVIVADTDGSGFIPADAALQINEVGVGFPATTVPPPPTPVNTTPIGNNVDPMLTLPSNLHSANGVVSVPVNLDETRPAGSTGLTAADLALTYNPSLFTVSASDIHAGSVLGNGWTIVPTIDQATGQIGIALSSDTPILQNLGGSLVTIDFHQIGTGAATASIELAASVNLNGQVFTTMLQDAVGQFTLTPAPTNSFNPRVDGVVTLAATPPVVVVSTPVVVESLTAATPPSVETTETLVDVTETIITTAVVPTLEAEEIVVHVSTQTDTVPVVPVHAPATTPAVSSLPIAGLVFQFANTPVVNAQGFAVARLADQLFQSLLRPTTVLDAAQAGTVHEVYDRVLAGQMMLPSATPDTIDRLNWDDMGGDLDVPVASSNDLNSRHARRQETQSQNSIPAAQPATVDQAALDQVFSQNDDSDVAVDDE